MFTFKGPSGRFLSEQPGYRYQQIKFGDERDSKGENGVAAISMGLGILLFITLGFLLSVGSAYVLFVIARGVFRWAQRQ